MRFFSSSITGCVFYAADCEDWRLWDCQVSESSFEKANLSGAAMGTWRDGRPNDWFGISFDGADLRDTNSTGASFVSCSFRGARLKGVHFLQSRIVSCVFAGRLEASSSTSALYLAGHQRTHCEMSTFRPLFLTRSNFAGALSRMSRSPLRPEFG
jgi:uncharacterized protein YjbI with pentapeptide repeats